MFPRSNSEKFRSRLQSGKHHTQIAADLLGALGSESYDDHNIDNSTMEGAKIGDGTHFVNDAALDLIATISGRTSTALTTLQPPINFILI